MSISLYDEIMGKLNSLSDEEKKPENIRKLMVQWTSEKNPDDVISTLCAFYNFMDGKEEYSFIHSDPSWSNFFARRFSNYFTFNTIKKNFDNIIFNDKIVDIILKFASEEVQNQFYIYTKKEDIIGRDFSGNYRYAKPLLRIEKILIEKGIINSPVQIDIRQEPLSNENNKDVEQEQETKLVVETSESEEIKQENAEIDEESELNQESSNMDNNSNEDNIEDAEVQLTNEPASVNPDDISVEPNENKMDDLYVDQIQMGTPVNGDPIATADDVKDNSNVNIEYSDDLLALLANNKAKAATVPKNAFERLKTKINKKRELKRIGVELTKENDMTTIKLSKKETLFDKIATTSKKVLNKIVNVATDVVIAGMIAVPVAKDVVERAIENTKEYIAVLKDENERTKLKNDWKSLGSGIEESFYKAIVGAGVVQGEVQDFVDETKKTIAVEKQGAASKLSNKIRNFADRIEPSTDILTPAENEPKIIAKSGTKVDTIPIGQLLKDNPNIKNAA